MMKKNEIKQFLVQYNRYVDGSCHLEKGKHEFVDWAIKKIFGQDFMDTFHEMLTESNNVKDMRIIDIDSFADEIFMLLNREWCHAVRSLFGISTLVVRNSDNVCLAVVPDEVADEILPERGSFLWPHPEKD